MRFACSSPAVADDAVITRSVVSQTQPTVVDLSQYFVMIEKKLVLVKSVAVSSVSSAPTKTSLK